MRSGSSKLTCYHINYVNAYMYYSLDVWLYIRDLEAFDKFCCSILGAVKNVEICF